ncbi:MAG TPA: 2-C-methyl-D-erythritol 4-phosphate cytidylyltransferase [Casimicrobiaceae bacterium]|nr:2-C-methyl-D-erythritol 4-phosphate cytidylyltransferase [Casimicrobiaceae bacterium]
MSFHIVVPAAGNGFRFGARMPKQYLLLHGKPVLQHALERLTLAFPGALVHVVLAAEDHWFERTIATGDYVRPLRCGGATRAESVRNALRSLEAAQRDDWVLVHDAVRPCLDLPSSVRLKNELAGSDVGGFLAVPVSDTLKRVDDTELVLRTESRDALWRAQTPQMFRYGVLRDAFELEGAELATDEAHAVERLGLRPRIVAGSACNVKITFPEDMELAAAILTAQTGAS